MSPHPDVFTSPALPLLLALEAEGFAFAIDGDRLLVRPVERLSPELRQALRRERESLVVLVRICDVGVQQRRELFATSLASDARVLPSLVFVADVPYVAGHCFSCGDSNQRPTFGRCWRCALAWRLAAGVAVPSDFAAAYDSAKRVA